MNIIFVLNYSIIHLLNNVIKTDDVDFIAVELGALTKYCPLSSEMLFALLSMIVIPCPDEKEVKLLL